MTHEAFLIGISRYPDHTIQGVANDLALLAQALQHQQYSGSAIHVFHDTHTTRSALHNLFSEISAHYSTIERGTCYIHIGASGTFSAESMLGGILPEDGDLSDFSTAFAFAMLNHFLPLRPGLRVMLTIDT